MLCIAQLLLRFIIIIVVVLEDEVMVLILHTTKENRGVDRGVWSTSRSSKFIPMNPSLRASELVWTIGR